MPCVLDLWEFRQLHVANMVARERDSCVLDRKAFRGALSKYKFRVRGTQTASLMIAGAQRGQVQHVLVTNSAQEALVS